MPKAVEAAKRALELDSHLGEAEAMLATVRFWYDWDWTGAEKGFKRSLELNPGYTSAHDQYAWFLTLMGRYPEAISEFERATQLDPLSAVFAGELPVPYIFQGQYEKGIELEQKAMDLDPNFFMIPFGLGRIYSLKGNYSKATELFKKSFELGNSPISLGWLGNCYGLSGNKSEALKVFEQLKELSKQRRYVSSFYYALICIGLGDKDQAFQWLEESYRDKDPFMAFLKVDPSLNPIRSDPRFSNLMKRVGF
jgi:tetratricopeptide (TPR) repeat protein